MDQISSLRSMDVSVHSGDTQQRLRSRAVLVGRANLRQFRSGWVELCRSVLSDALLPPLVQRGLLGLILFAYLVVRLWTIRTPALDRTAWKEIDYIAISTNYWKHGFDFFRPEVTWPAEPPRVTEIELPVVPYTAALLYEVLGFNAYSVRLVTLLSFVLLQVYVFRLTKRELGPVIGLVAAFASSLMALYHPFGRFLLSEPLLIAMSTAFVFHFAQWVDYQRESDWVLAMLSLSLAISLKLTALYMLVPLFWIVFRRSGGRGRAYRGVILLVLSALILPLLWYSYAYHLENIGVHQYGIFRGHNKMQTLTMLTDPNWYRTMFVRVAGQVLGGEVGLLLCTTGIVIALWLRKGELFFAYLAAIGAFFAIVAEGNLDAPYRQMTSIPSLSVFVALGATAVAAAVVTGVTAVKKLRISRCPRALVFLVACTLLMLAHPVRRRHIVFSDPLQPMHQDRWEFAQEIARYVGGDAKLAVAGEYSVHVGGNDLSPVLFHYLGVQGWNVQPEDWSLAAMERLIQKGATHFVALPTYGEQESGPFLRDEAGERFVKELKVRYRVLYETGNQLLLDLRQPVQH